MRYMNMSKTYREHCSKKRIINQGQQYKITKKERKYITKKERKYITKKERKYVMEKEKISGRKRHDNRPDLAGEHLLGDLGQLILLLIFFTAWIIDSFFLKYSSFILKNIPLFIKIPISIIILFSSGYLAKKGLNIVFDEVREEPGVIRKGVFGIVRHPIYLGSILLYLGFITLTFSIISTIIWIFIIAFYCFIAKHEEKLLLGKFGKDYEEYMREVPMLIPRIRRK